jgi:hypothetical protein
MWCHVVWQKSTDVLKEHNVSTFWAKEWAKQEISKKLPASYLAYSSTLKMEAVHSSKTSVNFHQTTWHHIPEHSPLRSQWCENLKSNILIMSVMLLNHLSRKLSTRNSVVACTVLYRGPSSKQRHVCNFLVALVLPVLQEDSLEPKANLMSGLSSLHLYWHEVLTVQSFHVKSDHVIAHFLWFLFHK